LAHTSPGHPNDRFGVRRLDLRQDALND